MVNSALHTRTTCTTNARQQNRSSTNGTDSFLLVGEVLPARSASANAAFDIGSVQLVRGFIDHLVAKNASRALRTGRSSRYVIDWRAVDASVAGSRTLEQAIGRAVVIADQMARGVFDATESGDSPSSPNAEDPFFAFSLADVVPDFGDESRYRARVVRTVAKIFATRRTHVSGAGALLSRRLPGDAVLNS